MRSAPLFSRSFLFASPHFPGLCFAHSPPGRATLAPHGRRPDARRLRRAFAGRMCDVRTARSPTRRPFGEGAHLIHRTFADRTRDVCAVRSTTSRAIRSVARLQTGHTTLARTRDVCGHATFAPRAALFGGGPFNPSHGRRPDSQRLRRAFADRTRDVCAARSSTGRATFAPRGRRAGAQWLATFAPRVCRPDARRLRRAFVNRTRDVCAARQLQLSSLLNGLGPVWPDFTVSGRFRALATVWGLAAHQRRLHLDARSHPKPPSVFSSLRSSIATF